MADDITVALTTVEGIEIASVGEEWPAATGPFTLTQGHIESVVASQEDPAIKSPRVKLGHDSMLTPDQPNSVFGGKPVFGKFVNLRLTDNNQTLVGDITGIPKWAAEVLPYAWPSRSGEWLEDWTNFGTSKTWPMVLSAVALLGVELPAITTIEDLPALFTAEGPAGVKVIVDGAQVRASARKEAMPAIVTSVDSSDVRSSFFDDFAPLGSDRQWWWPNQVFINPTAVIASDDDTGDLYFVPYTPKDDEVEWGEPVPIKHQYVDKDKGTVLAGAQPAKVFTSAAEARPADRRRTNDKKEGKTTMATVQSIDIPALRSRLGFSEEQLPDDATEEQINELLTAEVEETEEEETEETESEEEETEEEPVANTTTVSTAVWEQMQGRLKRLEATETQRTTAEATRRRDQKADFAVTTGRITPAEKTHYREMLDVDEKRTSKLIDNLAPGRVPVDERGINTSAEDPGPARGTGLIPELNRNREDS